MKARSAHQDEQHLTEQLGATGLRLTPQRQQVYDVLLDKRDHPTAEEVFIRAKKQMPEISHATVYNCLDALVKSGLARQVTVDRGATRFCPNMHEHGHFHCDSCGTVFDVDLPGELPGLPLPRGFKPQRYEVAIHGVCAECAKKLKS
ncbi:MAG TPA: Fur family transcriptional regulator [Candidatus Binatia bacterium]|nr:Fur family transcriptional regulator [Candidatus Binatia bacterium]